MSETAELTPIEEELLKAIFGEDEEARKEYLAVIPQIQLLKDTMPTLPFSERRVLELRFGLSDGKIRTVREVCQELDISPSTVYRKEKRGVNKLRDAMGG